MEVLLLRRAETQSYDGPFFTQVADGLSVFSFLSFSSRYERRGARRRANGPIRRSESVFYSRGEAKICDTASVYRQTSVCTLHIWASSDVRGYLTDSSPNTEAPPPPLPGRLMTIYQFM